MHILYKQCSLFVMVVSTNHFSDIMCPFHQHERASGDAMTSLKSATTFSANISLYSAIIV